MATNATTPVKYKPGQHPNSRKNLRPPFGSGDIETARKAGRKGAAVTNKKKAELKNQLAIMRYCLKNGLDELPFTEEKLATMRQELGIDIKAPLEWSHTATSIDQALHGNLGYSKELWEADNSTEKEQMINNSVNFIVSPEAADLITQLQEKAKKNGEHSTNEGL